MKSKKQKIPEFKDYRDEFMPLLYPFVRRTEWGAVLPMTIDPPLPHPVQYIVCSYLNVTEGGIPRNVVLQQMQDRDMKENRLSDIQCNFVIDARGTVFEGRAWQTQPGRQHYYPGYEGKYIEIAYIGDFSGDLAQMSTRNLIEIGQKYKYLSKDFKYLTMEHRRKDALK